MDFDRWLPADIRLRRSLLVAVAATTAMAVFVVAAAAWPNFVDDRSDLRISTDLTSSSTIRTDDAALGAPAPLPSSSIARNDAPAPVSVAGASAAANPAENGTAVNTTTPQTSTVTPGPVDEPNPGSSPSPSDSGTSQTTQVVAPTSATSQITQVAPTAATSPTTPAAPTTQAEPPPTPAPRPGGDAPISGGLFIDGQNSAARWASGNASDPMAAAIRDGIGNKPIARWFGDWNSNVESDVRSYVNGARAAGTIPMLVAYNIPDRDCGQHSAGGAADFSSYRTWIDGLADGLGDGPAFILLEPDSLALNGCAGSGRNIALKEAVATIKADCSACRVYLDAGHSNWVAPTDMAGRLRDAGVLHADGFFSNASNYNTTAAEQAFGRAVLTAIGNQPGLGQVIDTSRNGNGPPSDGAWCDPPGRAVGPDPTTNTGSAAVHAFLWIKVPGEADGCIAGAGQFVADRAYELVGG